MAQYYFFSAVGTGSEYDQRETFKADHEAKNFSEHISMMTPTFIIILNRILEALRESGSKHDIAFSEVEIIHPDDWNAPDLGKIREHDFSNQADAMVFYAGKMAPSIKAYMEKRFGNPGTMLAMWPSETLGMMTALLMPESNSQVTANNPDEKPKKRGLFGRRKK